jgi:hypothetical protein
MKKRSHVHGSKRPILSTSSATPQQPGTMPKPRVRPWPSQEARRRALEQAAEIHMAADASECTNRISSLRARGLVEVVVENGPAVVCTAAEWRDALRSTASRTPPQGEPTIAALTNAGAVPLPVDAARFMDLVGADEIEFDRATGRILCATEGGRLLIIEEVGDALRVCEIGRLYGECGERFAPNMTTQDGEGRILPAYDDAPSDQREGA